MNLLVQIAEAWLVGWLYGAVLLVAALLAQRLNLLPALWQRESSWRWLLFAPLLIMGLHLGGVPQQVQQAWHRTQLQVMAASFRAEQAAPTAIDPAANRRAALTLVAHQAKPLDSAGSTPVKLTEMPAAATSVPPSAVPASPPWSTPAATADYRWQLRLAPLLAAAIAALLLSALLLRAARVVQAWRRQAQRIHGQPRWPQDHLSHELQQLSERAGLKAPTLRRAEDDSGPHAWSPATISLPTWLPQVMTAEQQRATLAHELAHLRRADPLWRLAYALQRALFPMPLAARARIQLDQLAEQACDDWAATQAGSRRAMAESLARCAQHLVSPHAGLASAMTSRRSPVVARVQHLLKEPLMKPASPLWPLRLLLPTAVVASALLLPGVMVSEPAQAAAVAEQAAAPKQANQSQRGRMTPPPASPAAPEAPEAPPPPPPIEEDLALPAPPAPPAAPSPPSVPAPPAPPAKGSVSRHSWLFGERTVVEIERPGYALEAVIKGDFSLNAEETDFAKVDGSVEVEETRDGITRELTLSSASAGLQYQYRQDGRDAEFDSAARAWWAGLVKQLAREGMVDAEDRVQRLLAQGGATAVLNEVGQVHAAHARVSHLAALYKQAKLSPAELSSSLQLTHGIDSDYELRRVLQTALKHQAFDASSLQQALKLGESIDSDYEARVFLQAAAAQLPATRDSLGQWLRVYRTVGSDYEARVALQSLIGNAGMQGGLLDEALAASETIGSDYERRVALQSLAPRIKQEPSLVAVYARAVSGIDSDYEARVAVSALMEDAKLPAAALISLVDAVDSIGSDYERRVALQSIAKAMPKDAALLERIRRSAKPLGSHERGVLEKTLDRISG